MLSFPRFGHPLVAWIALAPLLAALTRGPLSRAFGLGLLAGVVYFSGTVYWVTNVMATYGGLPWWVAVLVNGALVATLALFVAFFAVVTRRLVVSYGPSILLAAPLVWVVSELARTVLFTGFPWVLLGYSQVTVLPVVQTASLAGVFGVSALVASTSAVAVTLALVPAGRWSWRACGPSAAVLLVGVGLTGWGGVRVSSSALTREGEPVRVGLVQGNVDQGEKRDAARELDIFRAYITLTRQAMAEGADLVVWPESSTPFRFEDDLLAAEEVRRAAREAGVPILLGSEQVERGEARRYYNAAFLVDGHGETAGVYRKMHLVPFGEYVPMRRVFFFASRLVEAVADFTPGDSVALLPVGAHAVSAAICYEVVYPALVRRMVAEGSELLTTITNDAWFGATSAPYQHFAQASMRAVENGRYLVRAANTGISGVVDPYGRVLQTTPLFERTAIVGDVRFLTARTLYTRTGDAFAYTSVLVVLLLLVAGVRRVE